MFPFQSEVDSAVDTRSMVSGSGLQLALQAGRGLMACSTDRSRWIVGALLSACALIVQDVPAHGRAFDVAAQDVYLRLEGKDAEAVNEFQRRLTEFDAVRQHLDASLPPLVVTPDRAAMAHFCLHDTAPGKATSSPRGSPTGFAIGSEPPFTASLRVSSSP
jgi:hypothetical protein